jgi:uncharacterized protein YndB with AHSA1/START domain
MKQIRDAPDMSDLKNTPSTKTSEEMVLITRLIDAPRALVFKAWTDPEHLKRWHAPHGCTIHFSWIDVREGGGFLSCIRNPNFPDCWCLGTYLEIVEPERLVYTMATADGAGRLISPASIGMDPEWPAKTTVTITFTDKNEKTNITIQQTALESVAKRTGAYPSWIQMLDRLVDEITINQ